ncbi:hypothetical protein [Alteriqipengyuania lutimaris]|nr:hypothetical protein [Alteriqipengyuania lutimaris]MBB3033751.1 hypothetical protein [Alteriqipengyuania lutimaris]
MSTGRRQLGFLAAVLACVMASPGFAAPPPPPPEASAQRAFFAALPQTAPAEYPAELRAMLADDLEVMWEGEPFLEGPDAWIEWRESTFYDASLDRHQMLIENFYWDEDGRVVTEEFWMPIRKDTVFHPVRPLKIVRYTFADEQVIRIEYLLNLDSAPVLNPRD